MATFIQCPNILFENRDLFFSSIIEAVDNCLSRKRFISSHPCNFLVHILIPFISFQTALLIQEIEIMYIDMILCFHTRWKIFHLDLKT